MIRARGAWPSLRVDLQVKAFHMSSDRPRPNLPAFLRAEPRKELVHACFGAVGATEPDRPSADQIADNDPVTVSLADGDLVDADDGGRGRPDAAELLAHVFDLQGLDRLPVQAEFASYIPDSRGPTAPTHVEGEALGVERVVSQPVQRLLLHGAATPARARDGSRTPSTHGCRHRRDRARDGSCDRRNFAGLSRRPYKPFFSPAHEANKTCLGITEETADHGFWTESGEAICIIKPAFFSHSFIMSVHSTCGKAGKPLKSSGFDVNRHVFLPTRFGEEPERKRSKKQGFAHWLLNPGNKVLLFWLIF